LTSTLDLPKLIFNFFLSRPFNSGLFLAFLSKRAAARPVLNGTSPVSGLGSGLTVLSFSILSSSSNCCILFLRDCISPADLSSLGSILGSLFVRLLKVLKDSLLIYSYY